MPRSRAVCGSLPSPHPGATPPPNLTAEALFGDAAGLPQWARHDFRQPAADQVTYVNRQPSVRLRMALDRAKNSQLGLESWDFLFDELRLARWEAGALAKAIKQVHDHLGVVRWGTKAAPRDSTDAPRQGQKLPEHGGGPRLEDEEEEPEAEDSSQADPGSRAVASNPKFVEQGSSAWFAGDNATQLSPQRTARRLDWGALPVADDDDGQLRKQVDAEWTPAESRLTKQREEREEEKQGAARWRQLRQEAIRNLKNWQEEEAEAATLRKQLQKLEAEAALRRQQAEQEEASRRAEEEARQRAEEEARRRVEAVAEARRRAREHLTFAMEQAEAVDARSFDALRAAKAQVRAALEGARRTGVPEFELAACRRLADRLVRACVCSTLDSVRAVERIDVDALREAKVQLTAVIHEAHRDGMPEEDLAEAERLRRAVHNKLEDLKGSIRVFCRIRPLSQHEVDEGVAHTIRCLDSMTLEVGREAGRRFSRVPSRVLSASSERAKTEFTFDAVFNPSSQDDVFHDCRDLIQSVFDGYNVTIFAYGQTGAGKTHTLVGTSDEPGLAPQMITEVYSLIDVDRDRCERKVSASMLELYRNELVDLLDGAAKKVNIRTDKDGLVQIENATEVACGTAADLAEVLDRGLRFRKTAATAMNSEGSRSHLILTVQLTSVNHRTGQEFAGKIQLVDLAGSERLKRSLATGERQKEAIDINKSLTSLGDVIEAITQRQNAVPYRNHKLTRVLQDSLGHTAKTLMFVNCSPSEADVDETLVSLKYATRAKRIPCCLAAPPGASRPTTPRPSTPTQRRVCHPFPACAGGVWSRSFSAPQLRAAPQGLAAAPLRDIAGTGGLTSGAATPRCGTASGPRRRGAGGLGRAAAGAHLHGGHGCGHGPQRLTLG